jgi:hypothetical protein
VSDDVGSVGEEAAKLLQALQDWAKDSGADYAEAASSAAEGAASTWQRVNEHVATGGEDCRYCPLCQVISVVRGTSPEVRDHLATAATSLMHAAAGMLATAVPEPGEPRGRRSGPVEKIDLDDQEWEDDR